jgi:hypothetical protein
VEDVIAAIRGELVRLGATEMDVGRIDEIRVKDRRKAYAPLEGAPVKNPHFHWFGKATEIYERLSGLQKTFTPNVHGPALADNGSTAGRPGGRDDDLIDPSLRWVSCPLDA